MGDNPTVFKIQIQHYDKIKIVHTENKKEEEKINFVYNKEKYDPQVFIVVADSIDVQAGARTLKKGECIKLKKRNVMTMYIIGKQLFLKILHWHLKNVKQW